MSESQEEPSVQVPTDLTLSDTTGHDQKFYFAPGRFNIKRYSTFAQMLAGSWHQGPKYQEKRPTQYHPLLELAFKMGRTCWGVLAGAYLLGRTWVLSKLVLEQEAKKTSGLNGVKLLMAHQLYSETRYRMGTKMTEPVKKYFCFIFAKIRIFIRNNFSPKPKRSRPIRSRNPSVQIPAKKWSDV